MAQEAADASHAKGPKRMRNVLITGDVHRHWPSNSCRSCITWVASVRHDEETGTSAACSSRLWEKQACETVWKSSSSTVASPRTI